MASNLRIRQNARGTLSLNSTTCPSAVAQYWLKKGMDPSGFQARYIDEQIGRGVFTLQDIKKGDFLLEYSGELISKKEALQREEEYKMKEKGNYMFFFKVNGTEYWRVFL
ncbi:N-lysine methyltransferase KMT5A-A-like [Lineus longissimus]|uniref:N-lysine methyltransferase KMT5A-A-like n=1 Tax=Lineus longissimus TaxID=88925 RepID=UPI00315DEA11